MTPDQNAAFLRRLRQGATVVELAEAAGMSRQAISRHLQAMRQKRIARVDAWANDALGRPTVATWRIGTKKSAPKPKHKTDAERQKAYRERKKMSDG